MERWRGRVALVTGASAGIGRGIALKLASCGLKVVVCARSFEKLQDLQESARKAASSGEIYPIKCDVQNEGEIIAMFDEIKKKYKRLDVCINNAGVCHAAATLLDGTTEHWREMLNVNILALSICTREAVALMSHEDEGQIMHISSMAGHRLVDCFMYTCTKQAVRALTEGLRQELRNCKSRIRVASISPANVETDMISRIREHTLPPAFKQLDVSDIEDAVVYILSAPPHAQVHDVLIRAIEQDS